MENIIPPIIAGIFTLLAPVFTEWWRRQQLKTDGVAPKVINPAAYEMAYRGTLHELAGRRRKCRRQAKTGKAWLREATYQHRPSARAGRNDAIDDVKMAVVASTMIDQVIHCDERFLESEMSGRLQVRIGSRPAAQILQSKHDARQAAELYQQAIQGQMRRLNMISSAVQLFFGVALFGTGAFLLAMIPSVWPAFNGLHPEVLTSEWVFQLKASYAAVGIASLSGGIALLLRR